ncbi:MAG: cytochrome c-type biogenesis protein CcmH [Gammaproteobacteria bacterium]|tara:strand:- start:9167 stop:9559 length:393 start_codon:yes stop_codon:yes gene_type:complete
MKNLLNIFKLLIVLSLPISLSAENLYENLNAEELKRLNYLSDNIRCPKCSYGNISSSNAPISKDLKEEIAELIREGNTNDEIFDLMEKRYGDYVILKTDLKDNKTLFLVPLMILIISILLVTTYTIKKSK